MDGEQEMHSWLRCTRPLLRPFILSKDAYLIPTELRPSFGDSVANVFYRYPDPWESPPASP